MGEKSKWNVISLHKLPIQIIDGDRSAKYPKRDEFQDEGIIFLSSTNIVGNRLELSKCNRIVEGKYNSIRKGRIKHLDIVMTTRGNGIGKVALINQRFIARGLINAQLLLLRANAKSISPTFLFYVACSKHFQREVQNFASGSAQPQIPITALRQISIQIPPLPTQRKIAAILSAYDELIENNLRRIKILEEMAQNLYREWFVKFRFPGHEQARFVDSALGQIPEGWEVADFSELYITSSGGTPRREVAEYYGGNHPWIKTRELNDGFVLETEEKLTDLGLKKSSAKIFPENTVILAIYGATIGKLGILSVPSATNQACVAILPKEIGFGRAFAFLFLRENRKKLIGLGQGAAQQNISQVVLKKFPVLRPPLSVMQEFSILAEPIFNNLRNLQQKNATLRRTRDLLLPKLISGEVDVSDLDITIPEEGDGA